MREFLPVAKISRYCLRRFKVSSNFFTPAHFKRSLQIINNGHILKSVIKSNRAFIIVKGV